MARRGTLPLIVALVCFIVFFGNVAAGAAGLGVWMGDVAEMLTLLTVSVFFVAAILRREAYANNNQTKPDE